MMESPTALRSQPEWKAAACQAFVQALRTGEPTTAERAVGYFSPDISFASARGERIRGAARVRDRITGQWPQTSVLARGAWSEPVQDGAGVVIEATFPGLGAAPESIRLTFRFNDSGLHEVTESQQPATREAVDRFPPHVVTAINRALADGCPMTLAYVDVDGRPHLSLRGSLQVSGPRQLCAWLRSADSGLATAVEANQQLSVLYRESRSRTTIVVQGQGRIASDPVARREVYDMAPEVERRHDTSRKGAALTIEVTSADGTTPQGPFTLR